MFSVLILVAAVLPPDVKTARELCSTPVGAAEKGLSVRLTGVVTFCPPRGKYFYLWDDTGVVHVSCAEAAKVKPGDRVNVVGFPRPAIDPIRLDNARLQVTGTAPLPPAQPGVPKAAAEGKLEGQVARFTGRVVDPRPQSKWMTLTVEAENRKAGSHPPAARRTCSSSATAYPTSPANSYHPSRGGPWANAGPTPIRYSPSCKPGRM